MSGRMLEKIRPEIPEYHTRAMRQELKKEINRLGVSIPPHIVRFIYQRLTLDGSADQNPAITERIEIMLNSSENQDLVLDLRHLNKGRPSETFKQFFDTANEMIQEWAGADERRHGVAHMSQFISIRDLINQVKAKLPDDVPIPSESTVELAFAPPNMCSRAARRYTGRIDLKHQVQRRQLRNLHLDFHYCSAQFKYLREMAIQFKENCLLLSADDKAKVLVGEPNLAISTGTRGRRSITSSGITIAALDHDVNQKASITPSVLLDIDIPGCIEESFYRGQVTVTLKDSVFEASNPNRFVAEVINYWHRLEEEKRDACSIIFLVTDGGPEHRTTFESVKLALIHLFKVTGVDMVVAIRMAPGQSFVNPVERIMSILNIGLQNVALERPSSSVETERYLDACPTMDAIRKKEAQVKGPWLKCMQEVKDNLKARIEKCVLKEVPFKTLPPATEEQVESVKDTIKLIDGALDPMKLTKADVKGKAKYQDFKQKHCHERNYNIQVGVITEKIKMLNNLTMQSMMHCLVLIFHFFDHCLVLNILS